MEWYALEVKVHPFGDNVPEILPAGFTNLQLHVALECMHIGSSLQYTAADPVPGGPYGRRGLTFEEFWVLQWLNGWLGGWFRGIAQGMGHEGCNKVSSAYYDARKSELTRVGWYEYLASAR